jgi:hypothetical protein
VSGIVRVQGSGTELVLPPAPCPLPPAPCPLIPGKKVHFFSEIAYIVDQSA